MKGNYVKVNTLKRWQEQQQRAREWLRKTIQGENSPKLEVQLAR